MNRRELIKILAGIGLGLNIKPEILFADIKKFGQGNRYGNNIAANTHHDIANFRGWFSAVILGSTAHAVWPTANKAFFFPFLVEAPKNIDKLAYVSGGIASGNFDLGIYDQSGNLLISTGSNAASGPSSAFKYVTISPLRLNTGLYYIGMSFDNTTVQVTRYAGTIQRYRLIGAKELVSAFPLPSDASAWVLNASSFQPRVGMVTEGYSN